MSELDQPMPQNPEAERAVLASVLLNNAAFYRVASTLETEDFFRDQHRVVYGAMRRMAEKSQAIELLTLKEELAKREQLGDAGGIVYLSALLDTHPDVANVERYAAIVKEKSTLRRLIVMSNSVLKAAMAAPAEPTEVMALAESQLYGIAQRQTDQSFVRLAPVLKASIAAIEAASQTGGALTGLPTGYDRFNEMTQGLQRQDLIILAARPSMGKTTLAMNIAESIAIPGRDGGPKCRLDRLYNVGVFSLEMSKEQLSVRMLSSESGVPSHVLRSGMLSQRNWADVGEASSRLAKGTLYIDDTAGIDPLSMRAKAKRLKSEMALDLVIVDYLQLMAMKGKVESRQQEISQISRSLKGLAKELNVPVLALSQLSRRPEQRQGDHRPQLSDLRESGSIEQDADLVAFIYRDEVYNKDSEDKGMAEIIVAKQRNGPIGDFKLVFRNDITKFFNYEPEREATS